MEKWLHNKDGRSHSQLLWKQYIVIAAIAAIAGFLTAFMYLSDRFNWPHKIVTHIDFFLELIIDYCAAVLSLIISFRLTRMWRYLFLFLSLVGLFLALSSTRTLLLHWIDGQQLAPLTAQKSLFIGVFLYLIKPIFWCAFSMLALWMLKPRKRILLIITPTLLTVIAVIFYIAHLFFIAKIHSHHLSTWTVVSSIHTLIVFLFLIYTLPIAKNKYIFMLILSFLLTGIGEVLDIQMNFLFPKAYILRPSVFLWIFGKLLRLYSLVKLCDIKNCVVKQWFYRPDSARAQIIYWSNNVTSMLFLLTSIRSLLVLPTANALQFIFQINITIFIIFSTAVALVARPFANLFTKDFRTIDSVSSFDRVEGELALAAVRKPYFRELRNLSTFLGSKMNSIKQKIRHENHLVSITKKITADIDEPLLALEQISQHVEAVLGERQTLVYKNALKRIQNIGDDLKDFEKNAGIYPGNEKASFSYQCLASLLSDLIKEMQYSYSAVTLKADISTSAWHFKFKLDPHDFERVCTNLIKNAVEASQHADSKVVTCRLTCDEQSNALTLTIEDKGQGMSQQQVNSILQMKSISTKEQGHGIGLRFVMEKIHQWGARCEISSKVEKGTKFVVTFFATDSSR